MRIYVADDSPSFTSRFSEFLTLFQQRQEIARALKELEYIVRLDCPLFDHIVAAKEA